MKLIDDDRQGGSLASCDLCKVRRIRCDRKLPKCSRCAKKGLECNYPKRGLNTNNAQWNKGVMKFDTKPKTTTSQHNNPEVKNKLKHLANDKKNENDASDKQLVLQKQLNSIPKPITLKLTEGIQIRLSLPKLSELLPSNQLPTRESKFTLPDPGAPPILEITDFFRSIPLGSIVMRELNTPHGILNPSPTTRDYLLKLYFSQFHIINPYFCKLEFTKDISKQPHYLLKSIYFGAYFVYPHYNREIDQNLTKEIIKLLDRIYWKPSIFTLQAQLIAMRALMHRGALPLIRLLLARINPLISLFGIPQLPPRAPPMMQYQLELIANGLYETDAIVANILHKRLVLDTFVPVRSRISLRAKIVYQLNSLDSLNDPLNQLIAYFCVIYKHHLIERILPIWYHIYQLKPFNLIFAANAPIRKLVRTQLTQVLERIQLDLINQLNKFDNLVDFGELDADIKCRKDEMILWFLWIIHWSKAMMPPEGKSDSNTTTT